VTLSTLDNREELVEVLKKAGLLGGLNICQRALR